MVCAASEPVLVRDIQVPQDAMQVFGAVVDVDEVVVAALDVDREILFSNLCRIGDCSIGGVVRRKHRRVAMRSDQA